MDINSRPKAFMLIGLPGSGKSTMNATFDPDNQRHHFSTDAEIEAIAAREGKTYSEVFKYAYPLAAKNASDKLDAAIERKADIVFDQTNLSSNKRTSTILRLPEDYYSVGLVLLPPSNEHELLELKNRLNSRPGKTIDWSIIVTMMSTFDIPTTTEGFDQVSFYNPFLISPDRIVNNEVFNVQSIFETFRFALDNMRYE